MFRGRGYSQLCFWNRQPRFGFTGVDGGLGLEKALGQQLALRAETRYTQYANEEWVTPFDDVGVTVPAVLEANETSLSLRLARYF